MAGFPIGNAKNIPINVQTGTVPNVGGALRNWLQQMIFGVVVKEIVNFQVVETMTEISFMGVIQPLSGKRLELKPEGQRAWNWSWLHADPSLSLEVDNIINYLGVQMRVKSRKDYTIYGYIEYELIEDWTGAGPAVATNIILCENGDKLTTEDSQYLITEAA